MRFEILLEFVSCTSIPERVYFLCLKFHIGPDTVLPACLHSSLYRRYFLRINAAGALNLTLVSMLSLGLECVDLDLFVLRTSHGVVIIHRDEFMFWMSQEYGL